MEQKIFIYSNDQLRPFISNINELYEESKKVFIPYEKWLDNFLPRVFENPTMYKVKRLPEDKLVRYTTFETIEKQFATIADEVQELREKAQIDITKTLDINRQIYDLTYNAFKPEKEFMYKGYTEYNGRPIWFADASKQLSIFLGTKDLDLSAPYPLVIGDNNPHSNAQGKTGSGKSKLMLEMICNILLLFPPWEVDLDLIDGKMAEFHLFGKIAMTPHCSSISVTCAKEYLLDLFDSFQAENTRRQAMFKILDVSSLKDLRKKYNLAIPTKLIIVDELVAILTAINETVALGNDRAGEEKKKIFTKLLGVATKGRNAKVHMFISSQDLGSQLDAEVAGQLTSGVALQGQSSISRGAIGNDGGAEIDRVGVGVANEMRQANDNDKYNVTFGIPLLDGDDDGEGTSPAQRLILDLASMATDLGFSKRSAYYDADILILKSLYDEALKTCIEEIQNNKSIIQCKVPLGKEICYTNSDIVYCTTNYKTGDGFIIDAMEQKRLRYMISLICRTIQSECEDKAVKTVFYTSGEEVVNTLNLGSLEGEVKVTNHFPQEEFALFRTRNCLLQYDESINADSSLSQRFDVYKRIIDRGNVSIEESVIEDYFSGTVGAIDLDDSLLKMLFNFKSFTELHKRMISKEENLNNEGKLFGGSFAPRLIFWFDAQEFEEFETRDRIKVTNTFFKNSPKVGFINVVNCSTWNSDCFNSVLDNCCRNVLEFSTNEFYRAIGLGQYYANVNDDSIILHDRFRRNIIKYIKFFGGIK